MKLDGNCSDLCLFLLISKQFSVAVLASRSDEMFLCRCHVIVSIGSSSDCFGLTEVFVQHLIFDGKRRFRQYCQLTLIEFEPLQSRVIDIHKLSQLSYIACSFMRRCVECANVVAMTFSRWCSAWMNCCYFCYLRCFETVKNNRAQQCK